jgi:multiple sugar transport system ATP-binding protein
MTEVVLENVRKSYDGRIDAIPDLSLVCRDGEMLALLGPSGCGKSSTLKMIAGIERVSSGSIRFDGVDVHDRDAAQRNVAMVFEDYALYPHLNVFENIAFPLRLRSYLHSEIATRVGRVLDLLGLESMRSEPVRRLSGGAQQRVAIGRALVREPVLVMFDEPLSHMDADQKAQLRSEIKRLQSLSGLTSVLVTHDQTEAIAMADRVAVLDQGRLQQLGPPQELYTRPANLFVAAFIGEPPMNLLPAALDDPDARALRFAGGALLPLGPEQSHCLRSQPMGCDLIVGIRPEHLLVAGACDGAPPGAAVAGSLPARVRECEPRGDHDVLSLDTPLGPLVAEIPGPAFLASGAPCTMHVQTGELHFFDAGTGNNLRGQLA